MPKKHIIVEGVSGTYEIYTPVSKSKLNIEKLNVHKSAKKKVLTNKNKYTFS